MMEWKERQDMQEVVLCGASAYNRKFYLNEDFKGLPGQVKDELKIMCVLFTEDIGGIFQLVFDGTGNLEFRTSVDAGVCSTMRLDVGSKSRSFGGQSRSC